MSSWDFPGGPWLKLHALNAGSLGSMLGQGTRPPPPTATKDPAYPKEDPECYN